MMSTILTKFGGNNADETLKSFVINRSVQIDVCNYAETTVEDYTRNPGTLLRNSMK